MQNDDTIEQHLRIILRDSLGLDAVLAETFTRDTPLFGALPELDSMAVAGLLTEMEDRFCIVIDDSDVDGDIFATLGALADFVDAKLSG